MIIANATITRIDAPPTIGVDGSRTYVEGASTSIRCCWQDPKTGRKWILGAAVEDATAALYLDGNQAAMFPMESRVVVQVDGESGTRMYP